MKQLILNVSSEKSNAKKLKMSSDVSAQHDTVVGRGCAIKWWEELDISQNVVIWWECLLLEMDGETFQKKWSLPNTPLLPPQLSIGEQLQNVVLKFARSE